METISLVSCGWPKDCANGQIGSFLHWLVLDMMVSLPLLRVGLVCAQMSILMSFSIIIFSKKQKRNRRLSFSQNIDIPSTHLSLRLRFKSFLSLISIVLCQMALLCVSYAQRLPVTLLSTCAVCPYLRTQSTAKTLCSCS